MTHADILKLRKPDVGSSACKGLVVWQRKQLLAGDRHHRDIWRCSKCGDVLFTDPALMVVAIQYHDKPLGDT